MNDNVIKVEIYWELAVDVVTRWPGWKVETTPLVLGDSGSLGSFREELSKVALCSAREILRLACNAQF